MSPQFDNHSSVRARPPHFAPTGTPSTVPEQEGGRNTASTIPAQEDGTKPKQVIPDPSSSSVLVPVPARKPQRHCNMCACMIAGDRPQLLQRSKRTAARANPKTRPMARPRPRNNTRKDGTMDANTAKPTLRHNRYLPASAQCEHYFTPPPAESSSTRPRRESAAAPRTDARR